MFHNMQTTFFQGHDFLNELMDSWKEAFLKNISNGYYELFKQ